MRNSALTVRAVDWEIGKKGGVTIVLNISGSCSDGEGNTAIFKDVEATVEISPKDNGGFVVDSKPAKDGPHESIFSAGYRRDPRRTPKQ